MNFKRSIWLSLLPLVLIAWMATASTVHAQDQQAPDSTEQVTSGHEGQDAAAGVEDHGDDEHAENAGEHGEAGHDDDHGPLPPIWLVLPFVIILLMIATGPLFYAHHWHHHYPKYSVGLGIAVAAYYIFVLDSIVPIEHAIAEYLSFIALVASLFIAASGVFLSLNVKGTPKNKTTCNLKLQAV